VDGDQERALIDPGAGEEALRHVVASAGGVDVIINTHYHFDHIWGNHLVPGARAVLLNEVERECFPDLRAIGARLGILDFYGEEGLVEWIRAVSRSASPDDSPPARYTPAFRREWWLSTRRPAETYPYGEFAVGRVRVVMVHSPGHTAGFSCPYFPDEGLVYTGDIDLTRFGPWYFGCDGDIDAFVRSSRALLDLDAQWYLTGHEVGLVSKAEFAERLTAYLEVISARDRRIQELLAAGVPPADLAQHGLIYPTRYHVDPWVRMWDAIGVRKHLERLGAELPALEVHHAPS
jgi:glyoxylase-like metal-dependent hydrolase (beta-lactamase superfamily II)